MIGGPNLNARAPQALPNVTQQPKANFGNLRPDADFSGSAAQGRSVAVKAPGTSIGITMADVKSFFTFPFRAISSRAAVLGEAVQSKFNEYRAEQRSKDIDRQLQAEQRALGPVDSSRITNENFDFGAYAKIFSSVDAAFRTQLLTPSMIILKNENPEGIGRGAMEGLLEQLQGKGVPPALRQKNERMINDALKSPEAKQELVGRLQKRAEGRLDTIEANLAIQANVAARQAAIQALALPPLPQCDNRTLGLILERSEELIQTTEREEPNVSDSFQFLRTGAAMIEYQEVDGEIQPISLHSRANLAQWANHALTDVNINSGNKDKIQEILGAVENKPNPALTDTEILDRMVDCMNEVVGLLQKDAIRRWEPRPNAQ